MARQLHTPLTTASTNTRQHWAPRQHHHRHHKISSVLRVHTTILDMASSCGVGFVWLAVLFAVAGATQFRVGGQKGWRVPDANAEYYNSWAGRLRFQIRDQLLFVYPKGADSVLLVDAGAYNACNTSSYVSKFDDGSTVFTLDRSGSFFFISGVEAYCRSNEKLIVVVLADRSGGGRPPAPTQPGVAPSPSSTPATPPSAAPTPTQPGLAPSPSSTPATPPSAAPTPSSSPAPSAPPAPAPTTPSSSPSPSATGPATSPPPAPGSSPPSLTSPPPPASSANAPGAEGTNATAQPPPGAASDRNGAAPTVAGFVGSLVACVAYALLAP